MHYLTMYDVFNVQLVLMILVVFLGTRFVYRQWNKPKRNLPPGPVGLPIVGYLPFMGCEPHKTLAKLSKKYGNIIGLKLGSKYTVILNEYTLMKETYAHPASLDRSNIFDYLSPLGFASANGEEWQEQRRFCMNSTKELGLGKGAWESIILEEVSSFIEELRSYDGSPVEITHSLRQSLTSNIMSLLIGRQLKKGGKEDDKVQLTLDFLSVSLAYTGPAIIASLIPGSRKFLEMFRIAGYDRAARIISKFNDFLKEEMARHKVEEFKNLPDFINSYTKQMSVLPKNVNHYFNETNLVGNLKCLLLGASDTLFTYLRWLLPLMAHHKGIQQKVYEEIMDVLGSDGIARYEERDRFPYTFAVLLEIQRFASVVPLGSTRRANQDITIRDYTIPKGSDVTTNLWALHHDPDYWDKPETFKPERFLENDGTTIAKQFKSYAPFSMGKRNCPAEKIAWMEALGYFSEIIRNFEITAPPNENIKFDTSVGTLAHLKPQPLRFIKRET